MASHVETASDLDVFALNTVVDRVREARDEQSAELSIHFGERLWPLQKQRESRVQSFLELLS
jgi:hypothetical protein